LLYYGKVAKLCKKKTVTLKAIMIMWNALWDVLWKLTREISSLLLVYRWIGSNEVLLNYKIIY